MSEERWRAVLTRLEQSVAQEAGHYHTVDVDGWMDDSALPEVHDEQQVVVRAPCSQAIHLLPAGRLLLLLPITALSSADLAMALEPCSGLRWWVKREQRNGLNTQPCGPPAFMVRVEEQRWSSQTCCRRDYSVEC